MGFRVVGRILLAQGLSSVGTSMSTVALAIMVFRITGSVLQMGGILAASTLPLVVTAWIGGAFLDRFKARNLMVLADAARAVLICCMPFLARQDVGLVYVIAALVGVLTAVFNPGQIKLIGELVERDRLVRANSYLGVSRDGAELVGYLAGGVVASISTVTVLGVAITGYAAAFIVDAISYVASAALLLGLPQVAAHKDGTPKVWALVAESPAVFGRLWRRPALRVNLLLAVFAMAAVMMYVPNSYGLAIDVFGKGPLGLGALEVFVAAGLILGGIVISRLRLQGDKNRYVVVSLAWMAVCYVAISFSSYFWISIVLTGLAGAANVGVLVPSITMFQELPYSCDKGRLISLRSSFGQLGATAGLALGGLVGSVVGIKHAFLVSGVAAIAIAFAVFIPYRLGASRRARAAWNAATEAGATRSTARHLAREAAYTGMASTATNPATAAWAAAAEEATLDDRGSGK